MPDIDDGVGAEVTNEQVTAELQAIMKDAQRWRFFNEHYFHFVDDMLFCRWLENWWTRTDKFKSRNDAIDWAMENIKLKEIK